MKKVSVILLNYNGWKDTIECLESLLKSDYNNYEVIVVDNDSPNNSMKYMLNWAQGSQEVIYEENTLLKELSQPFELKPISYSMYAQHELNLIQQRNNNPKVKGHITFIQSGKNNGFASGNNIAIEYAMLQDSFECVWLLNNDTVIQSNTLTKLITKMESNSTNIGIYGTALYDYNNPNKVQTYGGYINKYFGTSHYINLKSEVKKIDFVSGASMLITEECLDKIGMLPEEYFLYYEETDYCFNAQKHGLLLDVALDAIVYHKEGASTSLSSKNIRMDLLFHTNRLNFAKKYLKYVYLVKLGLFLTALKRMLKFEFIQCINLLKLLVK